MPHRSSHARTGLKLGLASGIVLLLLLVFVGLKFKSAGPDLDSLVRRMARKEEILSTMRIHLLKSADIEKAAVMADTDELSHSLAARSMESAEAVERERIELNRIVEMESAGKERQLLSEFNACWDELRKVDREILTFAVENTNVKAYALSFKKGGEIMHRFERSIAEINRRISERGLNSQLLRLSCDALAAALKVHYLHAPHIAASNDAEMDRIEAEIASSDETVKESLRQLESFAPGELQDRLREAVLAYAEFRKVTAEVIRLSRQNTNIRSFELSLGRKRKATAQCDEMLASLQEIVRSRKFEATR